MPILFKIFKWIILYRYEKLKNFRDSTSFKIFIIIIIGLLLYSIYLSNQLYANWDNFVIYYVNDYIEINQLNNKLLN